MRTCKKCKTVIFLNRLGKDECLYCYIMVDYNNKYDGWFTNDEIVKLLDDFDISNEVFNKYKADNNTISIKNNDVLINSYDVYISIKSCLKKMDMFTVDFSKYNKI